ncbi:hypothetical protein TL16_g01487 [Triparma laevis f. inornata]|uniref:Uncharacterized protein n=1 Tax=Triparma laevis f. inornata TaxID=1714386 RepID=A0A9W6ZIZ5_9STRA|nr:hypothetical protein TL16_g01487 [Triparma laevis f. inornata]
MYTQISNDECSPSGATGSQFASKCSTSAANVFAALLGVAFAGQGFGQVGTWIESVSAATTAIKPALAVITSKPTINTNTASNTALSTSVPTIVFKDVTFAYPTRPTTKVLR